MREWWDRLDDRVMHWAAHTNTGAIVSVIVCFAVLTLVFLLLP